MQPPARAALPLVLALALASAPAARADHESWDAIYVGNAKAGYMHLWVKPVRDSKGRELINVRIDYKLEFGRGKDRAAIQMMYGTIETPEGEILRIDTLTESSQGRIRTGGDVQGDKLPLTIEARGAKQTEVVAWGPDVRGPYGAEMSLARDPMQPGQTRTVKTFIPDLNKVCTTTLTAVDFEQVPLGPKAESHNLLRVESVVSDESGKPLPGMVATLWVDKTGQIMKSMTDILGGMYTYRTTEAGAKATGGAEVQLLEASIIKVPRPIPNATSTRDVVYRITGKNPETTFPSDHRQAVRPEGPKAILIEVKSDGPNAGAAGPAEVGEEYRRANPLVNSDDPLVVRRMRQAVGNATDPWEKATRIREWVSQNLKDKNFSTAFAPAGEVAETLSGDCTEHGVLVAAMCRAAGVPCRCVVGLVYAEGHQGFGPHLWNEVYVNGRWVAIDAAYDQSTVDATHIKISETSLDGTAPFAMFLPLMDVFQATRIEPVEVR
jgi:hypothetical protein